MLTETIICGFGGQGVLFSGKLLANAALMEGKELSWLPSYGPEMRGGTCNCSVCISDDPIGSPLVTAPDIVIAMNGPSFDKFEPMVKPGGIVFADSSIIDRKSTRDDITVYYIPSTEMAKENGLTGMANIIILGKVIRECSDKFFGIDYDKIVSVFEKIIPPKKAAMIEKNTTAFKLGYDYEK
ncbi:MAG: 2-oxoacid:acceptor oxidoreductase family protein [Oscillospiraceae bacterium]|nr:2-oxoacid:acceptor oxidoreductase family protein [Oscillospiraceae bacterium]